jgi:hypothetical protein
MMNEQGVMNGGSLVCQTTTGKRLQLSIPCEFIEYEKDSSRNNWTNKK